MAVRSRRGGVPTAVFLATIAVALVAFFLPGWWGAVPLLIGAAVLAYLLSQRRRSLPPAVVVMRVLVIAFLATFALVKIF